VPSFSNVALPVLISVVDDDASVREGLSRLLTQVSLLDANFANFSDSSAREAA
jgi:FixJ family two-component response regulator